MAGDSADVWAHPEQFQLDENLHPVEVAGSPPDGFSEDGQLWGNPLFHWEKMKKEGYHWGMMRSIWASVADFAIVQMQDLLGLGSEGRMNTPSTLGENWTWR